MGAFILAGGDIAIILAVFYIGEYIRPIQLFNNMRSNNRINGFTMGVEFVDCLYAEWRLFFTR